MSVKQTPVLDHLLAAGKHIWDKYCDHPFVDGIGSGKLDKERFQFYMVQDYLYLLQYTKVFAMGIIKSDSERMMQQFAISVDAFLNGELDTHRAYMKRLGITIEEVENTPTALANSTYTSYMLNVAQIYGLPELIVSILSCAWTYEMIADTLLERYPDAADHEFYGQWIRTYTGKDFKNTNVQIIAMTEELCADAFKNPAHLERLTDVFVKCCRLEMGFWDMAWDMAL